MRRLYLFNPDNDLALASGQANFTPPKAALALRNAGSALPLWYGDHGDYVISPGINARWYDSMVETFAIGPDIYDHNPSGLTPAPWGWSLAARRTFELNGLTADQLPDNDTLQRLRNLSHRRTASLLNEAIASDLDFPIAPAAAEFHSIDDLSRYLHDHPASIVKSPWSCSGRGLLDTRHVDRAETLRRCEGTINRQGSVMVETAYDRTADFAMLFDCKYGNCSFVGYSLFDADVSGAYTGNILAPDSVLLDRLGHRYPSQRLTEVSEALRRAIETNIAPFYTGPLGIDMLLAAMPDGSTLLDATVEVNLRMTMGRVAHEFTRRYLTEGSEGYFSVIPHRAGTDSDSLKPIVENLRLKNGSVSLTPPGNAFDFIVKAIG